MVAPKAESNLASRSHFSQLKTPRAPNPTPSPPQIPPRSNVDCATFYETSTRRVFKKMASSPKSNVKGQFFMFIEDSAKLGKR